MSRAISFILVICLIFTCACSRAQQEHNGKAADFSLFSLDGEQIVLSEILKEKKALLVFWTSWCPYCRAELPRIEQFYQQNQQRVAAIGIVVGESKAQAEKSVQKIDLSYPILLDADGQVARKYSILGVPTVVAVNQEGKAVFYGNSVKELLAATEF